MLEPPVVAVLVQISDDATAMSEDTHLDMLARKPRRELLITKVRFAPAPLAGRLARMLVVEVQSADTAAVAPILVLDDTRRVQEDQPAAIAVTEVAPVAGLFTPPRPDSKGKLNEKPRVTVLDALCSWVVASTDNRTRSPDMILGAGRAESEIHDERSAAVPPILTETDCHFRALGKKPTPSKVMPVAPVPGELQVKREEMLSDP
jgi:hypothetical protein